MPRYTIEEIQSIVTTLAEKHGAERIYLFGSYARGEAGNSSDIDLRIDKGTIRGLALAGLLIDLEDAFRLPVHLVPTSSLDDRFLRSIQKEEILLYEAP